MILGALMSLTLSIAHTTKSYVHQNPKAQENGEQLPIRLVLTASKAKYQAGQPLELTAYLENVSQQAYYVGSSFNFGVLSSYHNVLLTIRDERNREVGFPQMSMTATWDRDKLTAEEVEKTYVLLRPGKIYGIKSKLECKLLPGQYHLTVTYRDDYAQSWMKNKKIVLPYSVWTEPVKSNRVTITVSK